MAKKMKRVLKLLQIGVSLWSALAIITFMLAAIGANSYTFANEGKTVIQAAGGTASIVPYWIKTGFPAWVSSALFVTVLAAAFKHYLIV